LAACVTVLSGAESFYRWEGKMERAAEKVLFIKTTKARFSDVESYLKKSHPYELPEIIALKIQGSSEYLKWIAKNTA
jgi:periplasmic divalent cation tolerance protein